MSRQFNPISQFQIRLETEALAKASSKVASEGSKQSTKQKPRVLELKIPKFFAYALNKSTLTLLH